MYFGQIKMNQISQQSLVGVMELVHMELSHFTQVASKMDQLKVLVDLLPCSTMTI